MRKYYLYLGLNERFAVSLLAENQYRLQHLEGAVRRLDERLDKLATRARSLRQEEITEEIEMIPSGQGTVDSSFTSSRVENTASLSNYTPTPDNARLSRWRW